MKRWLIIAVVAAALTAIAVPTGFATFQAAGHSPGSRDFYVNSRYGNPDPWMLNLIARMGYRQVSSG